MTSASANPSYSDIVTAHQRIVENIHRTPVMTSQAINDIVNAKVFFKCENLQKIGAFKIRGAMNAIDALRETGYTGAVATHSSGNHGGALALAAKLQSLKAHIVMPENSSRAKFDAVRSYGGEITTCAPSIADRDRVLQQVVEEHDAHIVHPFDNHDVIAGQGTAALEFIEQVNDLDVIMTPIGGGGLLSGTAIATRELSPDIHIVGVEPRGADVGYRSMKAGKLVDAPSPNTIADGLRAGLSLSTFQIINRLVDEIVTVEESAIVDAMRLVWQRTKLIIEPSSAVPVAALTSRQITLTGKKIGIVLTGGNVDLDALPWVSPVAV